MFCEKLLDTSLMSDRVDASQFQDRPTASTSATVVAPLGRHIKEKGRGKNKSVQLQPETGVKI